RVPLVAQALVDTRAEGIWEEGGRLYHAVVAPLQDPQFNLLGYLVSGFAITDDSARAVSRISGADVAFVSLAGKEPKVVATSSLPAATVGSLEKSLRDRNGPLAKALQSSAPKPEAGSEE